MQLVPYSWMQIHGTERGVYVHADKGTTELAMETAERAGILQSMDLLFDDVLSI